jgi:hypothetical protein
VATTSRTVAPALKALLEQFIDYAGTFPPAALPMGDAVTNFQKYAAEDYSWMLRFLVVSSADLDRVPNALDGRLSIIADKDEQRAASIESKSAVASKQPVYCEVAPGNTAELDAVKKAGCFAKIRTGGLKPEAIPSTAQVAQFILDCADRKLAFKATAGLHHPIRAEYALTYQPDSPRATMHGFLNVLVASALAWHGERDIEPVLAETSANAFCFDDQLRWCDKSLSTEQVREARKSFIHSVGSCSFEEPVQELKGLGLLG